MVTKKKSNVPPSCDCDECGHFLENHDDETGCIVPGCPCVAGKVKRADGKRRVYLTPAQLKVLGIKPKDGQEFFVAKSADIDCVALFVERQKPVIELVEWVNKDGEAFFAGDKVEDV
jgi:hypothetical protein